MATSTYLIAIGSNRAHPRLGRPRDVVRALLGGNVNGFAPIVASPIIETAPVGPSQRRYANAAAIIASDLTPPGLLAQLKQIERTLGRRRGRRWGARVIDLDIILWSGGVWHSRLLTIPHRSFRERRFVLTPTAKIARDWRDPLTGLRVKHLKARLDRSNSAA